MINTVYVIAGPTASGKSDLSISLANKVNGAVINSDSMQVYKNLEILTARPSIKEMKNKDHHLFIPVLIIGLIFFFLAIFNGFKGIQILMNSFLGQKKNNRL